MPLYEFRCNKCRTTFEELVLSRSAEVRCPTCRKTSITRLLSAFSVKSGDSSAKTQPGRSCAGCRAKNCSSCG